MNKSFEMELPVETAADGSSTTAAPAERFTAGGTALLPELVALRRAIHAEPEVGLRLPETQRKVLAALAPLDLELHTGTALSSVVAVLRGARPGPTVLLRADMDALPLQEATSVPFRSTNGAMHACGHDLHTAGLVGAAHLLHAHRDELAGDVVFMFQPGEEGFGGAPLMLEEGVLDVTGERPVAAYAAHVGPGPRGTFLTRTGTVTASSTTFAVEVSGRGGHGSRPHEALDPVPVLAEIVLGLQTFATRRFDAFDPVVLSVTNLAAGTGADNIIPGSARLSGTVRTTSPQALAKVEAELPSVATGIAEAHAATATTEVATGYPSVVNDPATTGAALEVLREAFGARVAEAPRPTMGAEDFSYVAQQVPATMLMLLASPPDLDGDPAPNHSPHAVFDDAVLGDQAAALALLAARALTAHAPAAG
ncbi:hippurate hydrolase [Lipingzhangella halophila]|uniref:Hippurate hydrolase n=1 Tax=Lipingzhangella halophila TaxID=1783352 RepID=A0A7W7W5G5_9ACTN|nr:M20 family metallopeptidase [Lipingzhangella halophila]MBB4934771.1 hippurate hydrolase [Lipingzhangella halophila]